VRSNTYPMYLEKDRRLTGITGLDDWLMTIALVTTLPGTTIASTLRADFCLHIATQHRMPHLHCLPDTSWPRKARRHTFLPPSMGSLTVRVAVFLLHLRHPRIQLHKAFHRSILVALSASNQVHVDLARHFGCDSTCIFSPHTCTCANTVVRVPGLIYDRLSTRHYLAMQTRRCRL
jgi:hypothetical protein